MIEQLQKNKRQNKIQACFIAFYLGVSRKATEGFIKERERNDEV